MPPCALLGRFLRSPSRVSRTQRRAMSALPLVVRRCAWDAIVDSRQLPTTATDALGVGIASSADDSHSLMKQPVIRLVLANHQRRVFALAAIGMVNDGRRGERLAQRPLSAQTMHELQLSALILHAVPLHRLTGGESAVRRAKLGHLLARSERRQSLRRRGRAATDLERDDTGIPRAPRGERARRGAGKTRRVRFAPDGAPRP